MVTKQWLFKLHSTKSWEFCAGDIGHLLRTKRSSWELLEVFLQFIWCFKVCMYKPFIKIKIIKQCKVSSQSHRYNWHASFSQLSVGRRAVLFYCSDIMTEPNLTRLPGYYSSCEAFFHKYSMDISFTKISQEIRFLLQGWFL